MAKELHFIKGAYKDIKYNKEFYAPHIKADEQYMQHARKEYEEKSVTLCVYCKEVAEKDNDLCKKCEEKMEKMLGARK